ncbi:MAG TPA: alpha/beta hydrolase-fold protein [Fimbriiglobus sp.]|jgi:hypothetical protein
MGVGRLPAILLLLATAPAAVALPPLFPRTRGKLDAVNAEIHGKVLDFTHNHGGDRRLWSPALCEKRDVYVYLPPGYDPKKAYPGILWLHGIGQDETSFLNLVGHFDSAVVCGKLTPCIIVVPDGSIKGHRTLINNGSFYLNGVSGRFEDYIIDDVWGWAKRSFAIRPERDAHVLAGGSMGGFGAYSLGIRHGSDFGVLVGLLPPLDVRYGDCHGRYFVPYDPNCFAYRTDSYPLRIIGKFYGGLLLVREPQLTRPVTGTGRGAVAALATRNPVEMLSLYDVRPGQFKMYIGYLRGDQLNIDAQCEHFLDVARQRGLDPHVTVLDHGRHSTKAGMTFFPDFCQWAKPRLGPYAPAVGK